MIVMVCGHSSATMVCHHFYVERLLEGGMTRQPFQIEGWCGSLIEAASP